jgi:hypothetical protein
MKNINHPRLRRHYKIPALPKCDFCSSVTVCWLYLTRAFTVPRGDSVIHFGPDWATCHQCHQFIERKDCDGFVKRVAHGLRIDMNARPDAGPFYRAEFESFLRSTNGPPLFMPEALCGTN